MSRLVQWVQNLIERSKRLPRNLKLFLINVVAYGAAMEGISTVLLNLYLLRLGYGTEFIGTLNSAGLFVFALVSLPIGAVQRFSSRHMLQFGQLLSLVGLAGIPLAYFADTGQATLLIAFRIIGMIGLSFYFVHQIPFAMDITQPARHSQAMAATMAMFSLSAFLGSWIGGLLPEWFGRWSGLPQTDPLIFQWSMWVGVVIILPSIVMLQLIPEGQEIGYTDPAELQKPAPRIQWRAIIGLVVIILVVRAIQTSGVGIMITLSNVYFDDALGVPTGQIGLISGLGRLLGVPISFTIPWMVNRFGNFNFVLISMGAIVILMIPMALIPFFPVAAVALIAINSMGSWRYLSFISYTMSLVPERQRSLMSGVGEMAIGAGFALSTFIGGYLIAWYGYRELFLFGAAGTAIGTLLFWIIFRNWRTRAQERSCCGRG